MLRKIMQLASSSRTELRRFESFDVIPQQTKPLEVRLCSDSDSTNNGRLLFRERSVKGNGTRSTPPGSNSVPDFILGVLP